MSTERTFDFTDPELKALPIPPKERPEKVWNEETEEWDQPPWGQVDYFDEKERGLGLRVSYGGRKSFFLMYLAGKKRQRVSPKPTSEYGKLEEGKLSLAAARKWAKVEKAKIAQERNPAAEARAQRKAPTVKTLAADFITHQRRQGRKSVDAQERMLNRNVLPEIGDMKAREVGRLDVKKIMDDMTDRGAPVQANRVHEVVRAMFAFGLEEETYGLEHNPASSLAKRRNPERGRERWLTLEEIGSYWKALEEEPQAAADAIRLCLLTGQRQGNVLAMRRDQLALEDHLWIIPASTTKTNQTYKVPLSDSAVGIIKDRIAAVEGEEERRAKRLKREPRPVTWLFPARVGRDHAKHTFISKPHRSACDRAKIEDYRPHDHRHTFATHCEQMGISRLIWDGILGHVGNGMADLYSGHDFANERLGCVERWADRIKSAVSPNVVQIDSEKRRA